MNRKFFTSLSALVAAFLFTTVALAQSGGMYDLSWNVFDGGGATFSTGGAYSLGGTAGQPEAGLMNGGAYALTGGFWQTLETTTAIDLVSFDAQVANGIVKLTWVTNSERTTRGYNVWRNAFEVNDEYIAVNPELILPTNPGVDFITTHTYTDEPGEGEYYYRVEIVHDDGASEWSEPLRVDVGGACAAKPTKPKLVAPKHEQAVKKTRVKLKWQANACATYYKLIVRRASKQGHVSMQENALTVTELKTKKLRAGQTFFWQVRACNANGCAKSKWHSFSIKK